MNRILKGYYGTIKMEVGVEKEKIKVRVFLPKILSVQTEKFFEGLGISVEQTEVYTEISTFLSGRHFAKEEWFVQQRLETLYGLLILSFDNRIRYTFAQVFLGKER